MVKSQIGGTILLDALLLLKGAPRTTSKSADDAQLRGKLLRHCATCPGSIIGVPCPGNIPGCSEMGHLVQVLRLHAATCQESATCRTCIRWSSFMCAADQRGIKLLPARKKMVCATVKPAPPTEEELAEAKVRAEADKKSNAGILMMLARSALGELSAPSSPVNSPRNSPAPSRSTSPAREGGAKKRLKGADGTEGVRPSSPLVPGAVLKRKEIVGASQLSQVAAGSRLAMRSAPPAGDEPP